MGNKTQTKDRHNHQKETQDAEQLAKALGMNGQPEDESQKEEPQTEGKVEEKVDGTPEEQLEAQVNLEEQLDRFLMHLPEKVGNSMKKAIEAGISTVEEQLDIAKDYFKMQHPQGLRAEFLAKLTSDVLPRIQSLADEYMVSLDAQQVGFSFPTGGDAVVAMFDPTEVKSKKGKGGFSGEWGTCTVTDKDGKVMNHASPSSAAKSLGLRITGHSDMVAVFKSPVKAEGESWEANWVDGRTITVTKGDKTNKSDGIHITVS